MRRYRRSKTALAPTLLFTCILFATPVTAQEAPIPPGTDTPEGVVHALYDLCTFEAGTLPDWDLMRSYFLPQATVILRTGRDANTIFDVDGFIGDWHRFIERDNVEEKGFTEEIVRMKPTIFGDMAHIMVLYHASFPDWGRPPQPGVDFIQLVKNGGRWWIVSITNEIPTPNRSIPEALRGGGE